MLNTGPEKEKETPMSETMFSIMSDTCILAKDKDLARLAIYFEKDHDKYLQ